MSRTFFRTILPLLLALTAAVPAARAAVFIPTTLTDSADGACDHHCSLREAILAANAADGPDFILLNTGTYALSLAGTGEDLAATGDLDIRDDVTIVGRDAINTVVDGGGLDRVFDVQAGNKLELVGLTVRHGLISGAPGGGIRVLGELAVNRGVIAGSQAQLDFGGGIHGQGGSSKVTLVQSTVWGNSAANGGGLSVEGTIELINSTLSSNTATGSGGGLYATSHAVGEVSNSTLSLNSAQHGGGVFVVSDPFITVDHPLFKNTILAGNTGTAAAAEADCLGPALSAGHNLLGIGTGCGDFGPSHSDLEGTAASPINPVLSALAATGGTTPVHVPSPPSQAIDHGSGCEAVDQRGAGRSAACDVGSVEVTLQCLNGGATLCLHEGRFQVEATWITKTGTGSASAVPLTDQSGYFWFFDPSNVELTIKVLDGCGVNNRYWIFLSGLTNVGVKLTVTDLDTGKKKTYENPLDHTIATVLDTSALDICN